MEPQALVWGNRRVDLCVDCLHEPPPWHEPQPPEPPFSSSAPHQTSTTSTSNDNSNSTVVAANSSNASSFHVLATDREYSGRPRNYPPYVIEEYKLVFFSTLKVGCTEWRTLLLRMMGHITAYNESATVHADSSRHVPHLNNFSTAEATHIMTAPDWTRVIFVRDPMERYVSAYLNKGRHGDLMERQSCRPNSKRQDAQTLQNLTFDQCRHEIQASATRAFNIVKTCRNGHWAPQSHRISPKYRAQVNFVGRLETVTADSERLLRQIGAWEKFGRTGWGPQGTDRFFAPRNMTTTSSNNHKQNESMASDSSSSSQSQTAQSPQPPTPHHDPHFTHAASHMAQHMTPKLYAQLLEYYAEDYATTWFGFVPPNQSDWNTVDSAAGVE